MKSAIPWILAILLGAGTFFLYSTNQQKQTELDKLTQENQEVEKLRAENEELKKIPAQNEELARLRKDNEDLIRLRGEVQKLRGQNKQLDSALASSQAQVSQSQQQQQQQLSQLANENQSLKNQTQSLEQAQTATRHLADVCIHNLRQIDGAKQQWALEKNKPASAVPTPEDLAPYLAEGGVKLVCPSGGVYTINPVGAPVTCSVPGHTLGPQ